MIFNHKRQNSNRFEGLVDVEIQYDIDGNFPWTIKAQAADITYPSPPCLANEQQFSTTQILFDQPCQITLLES